MWNWFRSRKIKTRASVERIGGSHQVVVQAWGSAYYYVVFAQKTTLNSIFGNENSLHRIAVLGSVLAARALIGRDGVVANKKNN